MSQKWLKLLGLCLVILLGVWYLNFDIAHAIEAQQLELQLENYGFTGSIYNELPKLATLYHQRLNKYKQWKYRLDNETTSDKYDAEDKKLREWFDKNVKELHELFFNATMLYESTYGCVALRDFAIKNKFLDVIKENRTSFSCN